jgi:hypothetical protein
MRGSTSCEPVSWRFVRKLKEDTFSHRWAEEHVRDRERGGVFHVSQYPGGFSGGWRRIPSLFQVRQYSRSCQLQVQGCAVLYVMRIMVARRISIYTIIKTHKLGGSCMCLKIRNL